MKCIVQNANANKVSNVFAGTRDKCVGCSKTVYPIEKVSGEKKWGKFHFAAMVELCANFNLPPFGLSHLVDFCNLWTKVHLFIFHPN